MRARSDYAAKRTFLKSQYWPTAPTTVKAKNRISDIHLLGSFPTSASVSLIPTKGENSGKNSGATNM